MAAFLLAAWAAVATGVAFWLWLGPVRDPVSVSDDSTPDQRVLTEVSFADLPGWEDDSVRQALGPFLRGCVRFRFLGEARTVAPAELAGTVADWLPVCELAQHLRDASEEAVREFLTEQFVPFQVSNNEQAVGLFTGYYEPLLFGGRRRTERFRVPLYRRPQDLVNIDLGAFREDLEGRRLAGRLRDLRLLPYDDRQKIRSGSLGGRGLELLWVDDPIAAFFLQIQGSGQVELPGGERIRVGYADQNGHPYTAIGRELIQRGALSREEVSLQSIRSWLEANPEQAEEVMATNASFVFFRELSGDGPIGAQGVALTPGRSLAVDRRFLPLGAFVWVATLAPPESLDQAEQVVERLMVAQDTGGAIRGPVRGDIFWGAGDEAEEVAGRMKSEGRVWLILPRGLAGRLVGCNAQTGCS